VSATDQIVRGTALGGRARVMAAVTTDLVNEMQRRHTTWPVATAALGRTSTIAAMMALDLKGRERLTIQVKGDGPLGAITVDADSEGHVRGYVEHPHIHLPANSLGKLDVGGGVGQGLLHVMRDMGMKDYYNGSAELQSGEIADDFTYYFAVSEQVPSSIAAGVLVDTDNSVICAGGFIVQLMPGHTDADIAAIESRVRALQSVTALLQSGLDAQGLFEYIAPEAHVLERHEVVFECTCSRERLASIIRSLGAAEIQSLLDEQGQAEMICHFCNTVYVFPRLELEAFLRHDPSATDEP